MTTVTDATPDIDEAEVATDATDASNRWWLAPVALTIGLIWPGGRSVLLDFGIELLLLGFLGWAVLSNPQVRSTLGAAPRLGKRLCGIVLGAILVVQILGLGGNSLPFTDWAMYTSAPPQVVVTYEVDGLTADGDVVDFLPSFSNRTLSTKMPHEYLRRQSEWVFQLTNDDSDRDGKAALLDEANQELTATILNLTQLHNESADGQAKVTTVVITRVTLTQDELRTGQSEREELWRIAVDES